MYDKIREILIYACLHVNVRYGVSGSFQPSAEYIKKNYGYIRLNVPKDEGEAIKAYAQERGMTIEQLWRNTKNVINKGDNI